MSNNFVSQVNDGGVGASVAKLQAALTEKEAEILQLKEALEASAAKQDSLVAQVSLIKKKKN